MVWTCATFIALRTVVLLPLILRGKRSARVLVGTISLVASLRLSTLILVLSIPIALGEGKSSHAHRYGHDGRNNCFAFHADLHWVGRCEISYSCSLLSVLL